MHDVYMIFPRELKKAKKMKFLKFETKIVKE